MVRQLLISLALVAGCVRGGGAYRCATDAECAFNGAAGVCEAIGYCSFPDPKCDTGHRFGEHAGAYANDCVTTVANGEVSIGGMVSALVGTNLVLRNNGGNDLLITMSGPFTFANPIATGVPYEVTVAAQPSNPSQTCSVSNSTGVADTTDITDVTIDCATSAYSVGGAVLDLVGSGMVLTNNGGDDKSVTGSGTVNFTFGAQVASGAGFDVAIKTQPSGQTCTVSGGMGTVGTANVSSVIVNCNAGTFIVGGTVSGLQGTVILKDNGTDTATVTANGGFAFPTPLATSAGYNVTVGTQPTYPPRSQNCVVTNGAGTIGTSNVSSVSVACTTRSFTVGGSISGLTGTLKLANGADAVTVTAVNSFTFGTSVMSGNTYNISVAMQPTGQTCSITSNATGTVGNGNVTNVTISCTATGSDPGILCGGSLYCNPAAGELCCLSSGAPACATSCNGGGTAPVHCDDQADCAAAGQPALVCCGSVTGTTVNNIYCSGISQCTSPKAYYCDPTIATPCPNGGTCTATMYPFPGYYRCF